MTRRRSAGIVALVSLVAASCQALLGIDTDVNVIDAEDATVAVDGGGDVIATTDAGDADANDVDAGPCPVTTGGVQVLVPDDAGYCIDRTEVTVRAYREFLSKKGGNTGGQRAECAAVNTSFAPTFGGVPDAAFDDYPMVQIDFCDALAFCDWAGKRLCGNRLDGGPVPRDSATDPEVDQWYRACSHNQDALHAFPYGDSYDRNKCNSFEGTPPIVLKPAGSYPDCEGGYPGIFDMAGNVVELEDMCFPGEAGTTCQTRGGSFTNLYEGSNQCSDLNATISITGVSKAIGFRCCSK